MNSIKIDFQETPKSKWRVFAGAIMMLVSPVYFFASSFPEGLEWFGIGYGFLFFIIGLGHFVEGRGRTISRFFGEAYLIIDDNHFEYKPNKLKPAVKISWNNLDSVKFAVSGIEFIKNGSVVSKLEFSRLTYQQVQDIKSLLTSITEKYNININ